MSCVGRAFKAHPVPANCYGLATPSSSAQGPPSLALGSSRDGAPTALAAHARVPPPSQCYSTPPLACFYNFIFNLPEIRLFSFLAFKSDYFFSFLTRVLSLPIIPTTQLLKSAILIYSPSRL